MFRIYVAAYIHTLKHIFSPPALGLFHSKIIMYEINKQKLYILPDSLSSNTKTEPDLIMRLSFSCNLLETLGIKPLLHPSKMSNAS